MCSSDLLLERDTFDLYLPEFDKPWVIQLRETCCCSTNLCSWRPNTVYKNRSVCRHQSPLQRLLLLSRNAQHRVLQQPSRPRLRSPQAQRVALHLPRLPLETGLERLSPRYLSHESLDQAAPLLNFKNLRRALLLLGRGSCVLMVLQTLQIHCQLPTKGSRPLLLKKLTPITLACLCLLMTLRPPWTLRPMLGMTSAFTYSYDFCFSFS